MEDNVPADDGLLNGSRDVFHTAARTHIPKTRISYTNTHTHRRNASHTDFFTLHINLVTKRQPMYWSLIVSDPAKLHSTVARVQMSAVYSKGKAEHRYRY